MILLASTSDLLRVTTSAAVAVDVHASFIDFDASTQTPGRTNTLISTVTTTTVVASPAASTFRTVKTLTIRNRHASTSCDVTVLHTDGTTSVEIVKVTLLAGDALHYDEHNGCTVRDNFGRIKRREDSLIQAASPDFSTVVLASDVTNNNAVANTIADVTGLSFAVTAGNTYWFRAFVQYTAAATATGSRWSVNGPAAPTLLIFKSEYSLTTTTRTVNEGLSAYDTPAASNATSAATTSNIAWIEGFITPSASGTVIARLASEVAGSAIVAKAGSILHWQQVI
jgi:hypothetical protein